MKTPREILLARHRAAGPKLDAIRQAAVAAVCDRRDSGGQTDATTPGWAAGFAALCLHFPKLLWLELILPSRRTWTGLAAVWFLILVVNISQRDTATNGAEQAVRSSPVMMSWQTQQRLMNEVLSDRSAPSEAERPRNIPPGPRTEMNATATA